MLLKLRGWLAKRETDLCPRFNPIAPTLMTRALKGMLAKRSQQPSGEFLDTLVATSNGDIRSAIMALQFASVATKRGTLSDS